MLIGIFGGSFNPIHNGHVQLGRALVAGGYVQQLWYMVSPHNPLKQQSGLMPEALRLELVQLALQYEPQLVACDFEFSLPRPSYTVNTLAALRRAWPQHEFVLVVGADNILAFDRWRRPDEILLHHRLLVYRRPGYDMPPLPAGASVADTPLYNISSTDIRARLSQPGYNGEDLPEAVWQRLKVVKNG